MNLLTNFTIAFTYNKEYRQTVKRNKFNDINPITYLYYKYMKVSKLILPFELVINTMNFVLVFLQLLHYFSFYISVKLFMLYHRLKLLQRFSLNYIKIKMKL